MAAHKDPENTLVLETTPGTIVIALRTDVAPGHAERLKMLAREKFYDDVPLHRVIDGFMAQTGDGQHGNGTGGSKHPDLKAEFSKVPFKRGTVGMARSSNPNSANSQFFIMFADGAFLNGQYTVVGEVVSGMQFIDKIKRGEPPSTPDRIIRMQVAADAKTVGVCEGGAKKIVYTRKAADAAPAREVGRLDFIALAGCRRQRGRMSLLMIGGYQVAHRCEIVKPRIVGRRRLHNRR